MHCCRFKIDVDYKFFGLYRMETKIGLFGGVRRSWVLIAGFSTLEKTREHYELIKDLPEYLP